MKHLFRFFDQRPLLAVWLGFVAAFLLVYGCALLLKH